MVKPLYIKVTIRKNGVKDDNAIYMDNQATLNFNMKNNGKVYMADNIDGASDYNVNIIYRCKHDLEHFRQIKSYRK